jgi:hypothetical protein
MESLASLDLPGGGDDEDEDDAAPRPSGELPPLYVPTVATPTPDSPTRGPSRGALRSPGADSAGSAPTDAGESVSSLDFADLADLPEGLGSPDGRLSAGPRGLATIEEARPWEAATTGGGGGSGSSGGGGDGVLEVADIGGRRPPPRSPGAWGPGPSPGGVSLDAGASDVEAFDIDAEDLAGFVESLDSLEAAEREASSGSVF